MSPRPDKNTSFGTSHLYSTAVMRFWRPGPFGFSFMRRRAEEIAFEPVVHHGARFHITDLARADHALAPCAVGMPLERGMAVYEVRSGGRSPGALRASECADVHRVVGEVLQAGSGDHEAEFVPEPGGVGAAHAERDHRRAIAENSEG
jgi:hypothetical protein